MYMPNKELEFYYVLWLCEFYFYLHLIAFCYVFNILDGIYFYEQLIKGRSHTIIWETNYTSRQGKISRNYLRGSPDQFCSSSQGASQKLQKESPKLL